MENKRDHKKQKPTTRRPVILLWVWVLVFLVVVLVIAFGGRFLSEKLDDNYRKMSRLGPITLDPAVPGAWLTVDYPQMLSRTDQGAQHVKRIVVQLGTNPGLQDQQITLGIRPESPGIRLLDGSGNPVSGRFQITTTPGIIESKVFYIEHTQINAPSSFPVALELLPPTRNISDPQPIQGGVFWIQEEPVWYQVLREFVAPASNITQWLALLWGFASALIGLIRNHYAKMHELYEKASKAFEQDDIEAFNKCYDEYQQLRRASFYLISHQQMENLIPIAQTRAREKREKDIAAEEAKKAKEADDLYAQILDLLDRENLDELEIYLDQLKDLCPNHHAVPLLETIYHLEQKHREIEEDQWFFTDASGGKSELEKGLESNEPVIRCWSARLLAHFNDQDVKGRLQTLLERDSSRVVRTEAAWGLSRQERKPERMFQLASPARVEIWSRSLSLEYNPFALLTAEQEEKIWQNRHLSEHPAYDCLLESTGHTALFADTGCGKTSFRLQFKRELESRSPRSLIIEYIDFSPWMPWKWNVNPSIQEHVGHIACQIDSMAGQPSQGVAPSDLSYTEQLNRLVDWVHRNGYSGGIRVLVDNVDAGHNARQNPDIAERMIRDLMDTSDILTIKGLTLHFFLPSSLHDYIRDYSTLSEGLIEKISVTWKAEQLKGMLQERIGTASDQKTRSLDTLAEKLERPIVWDDIVIDLASGSPRRLIRLVNLLFRHRARQFADGAEAKIQIVDWAHLFEKSISGEI